MKLSKLKLKDFHEMDEKEMKNVVGGDISPRTYPGSGTEEDPYQLPGIVVTPGPCICGGCAAFEERNNPHGMSGPDRTNNALVTPLGEYIIKEWIIDHDPCCRWY